MEDERLFIYLCAYFLTEILNTDVSHLGILPVCLRGREGLLPLWGGKEGPREAFAVA